MSSHIILIQQYLNDARSICEQLEGRTFHCENLYQTILSEFDLKEFYVLVYTLEEFTLFANNQEIDLEDFFITHVTLALPVPPLPREEVEKVEEYAFTLLDDYLGNTGINLSEGTTPYLTETLDQLIDLLVESHPMNMINGFLSDMDMERVYTELNNK